MLIKPTQICKHIHKVPLAQQQKEKSKELLKNWRNTFKTIR